MARRAAIIGRFSESRSQFFLVEFIPLPSIPLPSIPLPTLTMIAWETIGRGMAGKGIYCLCQLCQFMHLGSPTPKTALVIAIVMAFLILSPMLPFPLFVPGPREFSWPEKWEYTLDLQLP
jgi:hypothetical protein